MTAHAGGAAPSSDRSRLRADMRAEMRAKRRALPSHARASASRQFARILRRANLLRPGRRIAVYVAHDSEADPSAIVRVARRNRCELYLPAIADYRRRRLLASLNLSRHAKWSGRRSSPPSLAYN